MNVTRPIIEHCVDVELEAARKEHEDFHSLHEAYAVTLEEIDEAKVEMGHISDMVQELWKCAKTDDEGSARILLAMIERTAVSLSAEAVQVAAMARKARRLGKGEKPQYAWPSEGMNINSEQNKTWFGKE